MLVHTTTNGLISKTFGMITVGILWQSELMHSLTELERQRVKISSMLGQGPV